MEYKLPNLKFLPWFTVVVAGPNVTRSPTILTITIIFCRHVTNVKSRYKISPIIFTITIVFYMLECSSIPRSPFIENSPILIPLGRFQSILQLSVIGDGFVYIAEYKLQNIKFKI